MAERLVVDSSIVIKWFIAEPYSAEARRILDDYQQSALALLAPDLLCAEVGNIVWKKQLFQGLAASDAQKIVDSFQELTIRFTPTSDLLADAYRLAVAHRRTVYDMLYVALSQKARCQFVTADEKLVNEIRRAVSDVIWIVDWQ